MNSHVREERGTLVVELEGEIDLEQSPKARSLLLECVGRGGPVLVDLSAVAYMDSSGVASLVEALQKARASGQLFALAAPSPAVARVLELARLDKVFTIHAKVDDGLDAGA